jgi:hypothetical protein
MGDSEMNASEPLLTCRKRRDEIKTGTESLSREEQRRDLFRTLRSPTLRWHESVTQRLSGTWEPSAPMQTEGFKQKTCENRIRDAVRRGGMARSSNEVPDKGMEPRGCSNEVWFNEPTSNGRSPMNQTKPSGFMRELYELRGSCTVLRAPRGEIPWATHLRDFHLG